MENVEAFVAFHFIFQLSQLADDSPQLVPWTKNNNLILIKVLVKFLVEEFSRKAAPIISLTAYFVAFQNAYLCAVSWLMCN